MSTKRGGLNWMDLWIYWQQGERILSPRYTCQNMRCLHFKPTSPLADLFNCRHGSSLGLQRGTRFTWPLSDQEKMSSFLPHASYLMGNDVWTTCDGDTSHHQSQASDKDRTWDMYSAFIWIQVFSWGLRKWQPERKSQFAHHFRMWSSVWKEFASVSITASCLLFTL